MRRDAGEQARGCGGSRTATIRAATVRASRSSVVQRRRARPSVPRNHGTEPLKGAGRRSHPALCRGRWPRSRSPPDQRPGLHRQRASPSRASCSMWRTAWRPRCHGAKADVWNSATTGGAPPNLGPACEVSQRHRRSSLHRGDSMPSPARRSRVRRRSSLLRIAPAPRNGSPIIRWDAGRLFVRECPPDRRRHRVRAQQVLGAAHLDQGRVVCAANHCPTEKMYLTIAHAVFAHLAAPTRDGPHDPAPGATRDIIYFLVSLSQARWPVSTSSGGDRRTRTADDEGRRSTLGAGDRGTLRRRSSNHIKDLL